MFSRWYICFLSLLFNVNGDPYTFSRRHCCIHYFLVDIYRHSVQAYSTTSLHYFCSLLHIIRFCTRLVDNIFAIFLIFTMFTGNLYVQSMTSLHSFSFLETYTKDSVSVSSTTSSILSILGDVYVHCLYNNSTTSLQHSFVLDMGIAS